MAMILIMASVGHTYSRECNQDFLLIMRLTPSLFSPLLCSRQTWTISTKVGPWLFKANLDFSSLTFNVGNSSCYNLVITFPLKVS